MNRYFAIQSWLALAVCVVVAWKAVPVVGTYAILSGAILSGVILCGVPSWVYKHETEQTRKGWEQNYWNGVRYNVEIITQLCTLAVFMAIAHFSGWRLFWFLTGGGVVSVINMIVRAIASNHHQHYV